MSRRPKVQSSTLLHQGFFDLKIDLLEKSSGETSPYTSLILPTDAAVILAQDPEGRFILNREYRHPTGEHIIGCPGGKLEPNEDPLLGAQREFFEETGYWSDEIRPMGLCYPFPAICNQKIYYFYAANAQRKADQKLDPLEYIETRLMTHSELVKLVSQSPQIDGILLTALWHWQTVKQNGFF